MAACLKNYATHKSQDNLLKIFALAQKLWPIYEACCQYRLRILCDLKEFLGFQQHGKLADRLRQFAICINGSDYAI